MATEDEVRRLILEVIGEEKLKSLRLETDKERESLEKLSGALGGGGYGAHGPNLGMAALEASRAIEDLQYGFAGVVNNIPGLVMALGGGAGLIATISLVSIGINQLIQHWGDLTGQQDKAKEKTEKLTGALKEQKEALEALAKVRPKSEVEAERARAETVSEAIGPRIEEVRKAVAEQLREETTAEQKRLGEEMMRVAVGPADEFRRLMPGLQQRFARTERMKETEQLRADEIIGRAIQGGRPELGRLQGIFPPETEIGARLREAGPERVRQRDEEERDIERQKRSARLQEQIDRRKEQTAQKNAQFIDRAFQDEEQDLQRQHQDSQKAAQEKQRATQREEQARKRTVTAREREAARSEREGIENVRFQVDQAIGAGTPAGMVAQQANAMLNKIAMTSGRTTNLVQAQGRLMLHLQQVAERQQRQLEAAERDLQRGWDNAFRRGK